MGIQINGNTDTITAIDGGLTVSGADLGVSAGTTAAPSISPTGDSNTGIFFPSADTIAFAEGGVEALRVHSSSNIGIGTNNPTSKLQVQGTIGLGASDDLESGFSGGRTKLTSSASGFVINHNDNSATIFQNQGTERVRIDSSGRVTAPYQPRAHITKTTSHTITTTNTKITFDTATYDIGSNYSNANDRYTAPIIGYYLVCVNLNIPASTNNITVTINKNGATYGGMSYTTVGANVRLNYTMSGVVYLEVSDYIEIFSIINSGSYAIDNAGHLSIALLG